MMFGFLMVKVGVEFNAGCGKMEEREVGEKITMEALAGIGREESFFDEAGFDDFFQRWQAGDVVENNFTPVEETVTNEGVGVGESPVVPEEAVAEVKDEANDGDVETGDTEAVESASRSNERVEGELNAEKQRGVLGKVAKLALNLTRRQTVAEQQKERVQKIIASDERGLDSTAGSAAMARERLGRDVAERGRAVETPDTAEMKAQAFVDRWMRERKAEISAVQEQIDALQMRINALNNKARNGVGRSDVQQELVLESKQLLADKDTLEIELKRLQGSIEEPEDTNSMTEWADFLAATALHDSAVGFYENALRQHDESDPELNLLEQFEKKTNLDKFQDLATFMKRGYDRFKGDDAHIESARYYGLQCDYIQQLELLKSPYALEVMFGPDVDSGSGEAER